MTSSAIDVRNVSKEFQMHREVSTTVRERFTRRPRLQREVFSALRDVNVRIEQGSSFALIGDNGSGKSTLLKLIAGIHRPTSGSIHTHGRLSALLELGAGFHPDLTGRENVFLNGAILGLRRRELEARFDGIVDFSGIEEFIDTPIKFYSSGMLVRLAFAVAVNVDPDILLIDEILAVGDLEFQRKCLEHLYRLRRDGTTIVLVSHDLSTLRDMCDQCLWLDHGSPAHRGSIHEVADAYLQAVNQREASRPRPAGATVATEFQDGDVGGSGEIRLTSVEYLSDGLAVDAGLSGQQLTIRLHFQATSSVEAADFSLTIHHESGAVVSQPRSNRDGQSLRVAAGAGYVDFDMDDLLLAPGFYELSTAITYQGHTFDRRDKRYELSVHAAGSESMGLIDLPGRWSAPRYDPGPGLSDP